MLRFLMWFTLGALLLLSSCTQHRYSLHAYRLYTMNNSAENLDNAVQPAIAYSDRIDTFYNNDFKMSFGEDMQAFYGKVDACPKPGEQPPAKLSGRKLYQALAIIDEPEKPGDISSLIAIAN